MMLDEVAAAVGAEYSSAGEGASRAGEEFTTADSDGALDAAFAGGFGFAPLDPLLVALPVAPIGVKPALARGQRAARPCPTHAPLTRKLVNFAAVVLYELLL